MSIVPFTLVQAIQEGYSLKQVKELVERGVSINEIYCHNSPLEAAIERDSIEIVEYILEHGDYINVDAGAFECVRILHKACEQVSPNYHIIQTLLQHGMDTQVNLNYYGETAFHKACRSSNEKVIKLLIDYGANLHSCGCQIPVIYETVEASNSLVLEILLQHGAEIYTLTPDCPSLLFKMTNSVANVVHMLLVHAANLSSSKQEHWNQLCNEIMETDRESDVFLAKITSLVKDGCEISKLNLYTAVVYHNKDILKVIWENIAPHTISQDSYFMIFVFESWGSNDDIEKLWLFLKDKRIEFRVDTCGKAFAFFVYRWAADLLPRITLEEWKELVQCLVERGMRLSGSDAELIIRLAENTNMSEYVKLVIELTLPKITGTAFYHGLKMEHGRFLIQYCLEPYFTTYENEWNLHLLQHYLGLFTIDDQDEKHEMRMLMEYFDLPELECINEILDKMGAKSLTELARDAVRKQLKDVCSDSRQFLNILHQLRIPKPIADIIQCKVPVNPYVYTYS